MSQSRTTTGILAIIVLAVIGYVLVTIPPRLFEGYHHAAEVHAWMGYAYLAVVGVGSLLLGGLLLAILLHVLKNTRQKAADHERRSLSPSQMSAKAQSQEIEDNLATGREVHLGLDNVQTVLLILTLFVSALTFGGVRTNVLQGTVHLLLFIVYVALIFSP